MQKRKNQMKRTMIDAGALYYSSPPVTIDKLNDKFYPLAKLIDNRSD